MLPDIAGSADGGYGAMLVLGLLMGVYHSLEPDHVSAVITQVRHGGAGGLPGAALRARAGGVKGSTVGALWGLGHMSSMLATSLLVLVLSVSVPEGVFEGFELAAGIMLVMLGALTLAGPARTSRLRIWNRGGGSAGGSRQDKQGRAHCRRPYIVGCVHGMAGSGALLALGAASLDGPAPILFLMLVICAGSIAGMAAAGAALSIPFSMTGRNAQRLRQLIRAAAGVVGVAAGTYIAYGLLSTGWPVIYMQ